MKDCQSILQGQQDLVFLKSCLLAGINLPRTPKITQVVALNPLNPEYDQPTFKDQGKLLNKSSFEVLPPGAKRCMNEELSKTY